MMEGGEGMMNRGVMRTKEPPLIKLVEKYLAENSTLSYINIEDMIDHFQSIYFRFGRMQRKAFSRLVREAYYECIRRAQQPQPEQSGRSNGTNAMRGGESRENDDVVEVVEERGEPPTAPGVSLRNDFLNTNLTMMYKNKGSTSQQDIMKAGQPSQIVTGDSDGNGVSTSSGKLDSPRQAPAVAKNAQLPGRANLESDEESDDDIQFVDEIQAPPRSAIQQTSEAVDNTPMINPMGENNSHLAVLCSSSQANVAAAHLLAKNQNVTLTVVDGPGLPKSRENCVSSASSDQSVGGKSLPAEAEVASRSVRNIPASMITHRERGMKRKNVQSEKDDVIQTQGQASKKLKKEVPVVSSGYRLQDFAGSEKVVEEVCRLLMHLKHPEVYKVLGVTAPRGFLLHGPPGVGKTLLANAIAGELQLPMLKITGTEFVSGISGESESNIRDLFNQAVAIAPCIIFIDEIDSVTPKRDTVQKEMERRIVAQLLSCVDDLMHHEKGNQILLIGATNRVEAIDTALRRAGRFDKEICLGIPDEKSREKILQVICKHLRLAPGFDLATLAKLTPGYVGADLQMLVREAAVQAVNKVLLGQSNPSSSLSGNASFVEEEQRKAGETKSSDTVVQGDDPPLIVSVSSISQITEGNSVNTIANEPNNTVRKEDEFSAGTKESVEQLVAATVEAVEKKDISVESSDKGKECEAEGVTNGTGDVIRNEQPTAAEIVVPDSGEDKMDVDDVDCLTPKIVSVTSTSSACHTAGNANAAKENETTNGITSSSVDSQKHMTMGKTNESVDYLRWIKETAPLSAGELDELYIFMDDFEEALKHVQPSSKREGFATVPDTTWDDIGALADIREELEVSILGPVKYSGAFETLGLTTPAGVLLCGPPGCGKTLLAKAVANEAGINFISVKGPELLNMYVGESERAVRQCFIRAKNSSPCVIFFDEIDALCPRRSEIPDSGSGSRIVNQLLTEMDGVEGRQGVFIMAATNRPDILDPAILRPGRLDKMLFVDLPTATDRFEILKAITKNGTKPPLASDVDLKALAEHKMCYFYTGADLAALAREASIAAFKDLIMDGMQQSMVPGDLKVSMRHFEIALTKTKPSVSDKDRERYKVMKKLYSSNRTG